MQIFNSKYLIRFTLVLFSLMLSVTNFSKPYQGSFSEIFTLRRVLVVSGITLLIVYKLMDAKKVSANHGQNCDCVKCASESSTSKYV